MAALQWNEKELLEHLAQDRPILVDYWAPWCGHCRRLGPAVEAVARDLADSVTVAKINIDDNPALTDREGIEVIPTLVLYKDGKALSRAVNPGSKAAIAAFVQKALEG